MAFCTVIANDLFKRSYRSRRRSVARWTGSREPIGCEPVKRALSTERSCIPAALPVSALSSFVAEAVDEKLRRDELAAILGAMDTEHGKPTKEATAWAKRVLKRSS